MYSKRRPDPTTEELHLSKRDLEDLKAMGFEMKPVRTDKQAKEAFSEVLKVIRQIGLHTFEALLTTWIQQAFPHLLPLWFSFIRFLHHPGEGFRWPY